MENNQILHPCDNCGEIISSKTLPLSSGINITPVGINGPLVAKIPVVLGEREIQIDVEAEFRLNEPFYEIKRIKKNVYLTQCKLLPRSGVIENGVLRSGKLFISGFVRKNIEYATADCIEDKIVSGRIAHTTIDVKFTTVTEVQYVVPPIVNVRRAQTEIDLLSSCVCHDDCKETLIGKSACEQSFEDNITFTESPYCELEGVRIFEDDMNTDPIYHKTNSNVQLYNKVIEKMVVYVRVKVLQLQQVNIPYDDPVNPICTTSKYSDFCE
ncbi:hypothetical protein K2F40_07155 [Clostridium sp. CM028]|uniref:CsxC family protein n=1 Tax=unclassified Clostridium TaxID=2614128 RepID=UPI001C6F5569|nr:MULTISPECIES: hypothetical protein [unclassified Clostridium]MBW9145447.1 hypothetical protein [Clostridium sp. CM027]MBW9148735.1 hypothetical protein [Clostridium sp. CM028]UVE39426.1 hypothetical protein KTC92_09175 [Clostridium sp. CM027]WLC63158.1 hypothetical protein KTC94_07910 [Clostridium sp. CM028]